jgi:hypothetical protein
MPFVPNITCATMLRRTSLHGPTCHKRGTIGVNMPWYCPGPSPFGMCLYRGTAPDSVLYVTCRSAVLTHNCFQDPNQHHHTQLFLSGAHFRGYLMVSFPGVCNWRWCISGHTPTIEIPYCQSDGINLTRDLQSSSLCRGGLV